MNSNNFSKKEVISIEVNGVRYDRLEDVPAEYRKFLEDKNGNGIPDFIEAAPDGIKNVVRVEKRTVHSSNLSDTDVQRLLAAGTSASGSKGLRCDGLSSNFEIGNVVDHARGWLSTLLIAFVMAIVMVVIFLVWIMPALR